MNKLLAGLALGAQALPAALEIITLIQNPTTLTVAGVQQIVDPLILTIGIVSGVSVNQLLVDQIVKDAVNTIQTALKVPLV